jgi:UDP-2,4-diacetamido-2,4,6-trideoxy-beta-L-altropyranose hydrolase
VNVLVRADADESVGTGHVVRCSALLGRLRLTQASVTLVSTSLPDGTRSTVEQLGWTVREIGIQPSQSADATATLSALSDVGSADLVVVDHYGLSAEWEQAVQAEEARMVVVDDLADRPHSCDVLIDPTIDDRSADRYAGLVGARTVLLLGPSYALLRPEFEGVVPRHRTGIVHRLLVFLGGATSADDVIPLLSALARLGQRAPATTIVLGDAFVGRDRVHRATTNHPGITVLDRTDDMAGLLAEADLAIGATGGAQWERCATGVPTLTVLTAHNQAHDADAFERAGATRHLGRLSRMTDESWVAALDWALQDPQAVAAMSAAAAAVLADRQQAWEAAVPVIAGPRLDALARPEGRS